MDITVKTRSVDGSSGRRKFKTMEGAQRYARSVLGEAFDVGSSYAVSMHGTTTLRVDGCSLGELFGTEKRVASPPLSGDFSICECSPSYCPVTDAIVGASYREVSRADSPTAALAALKAARESCGADPDVTVVVRRDGRDWFAGHCAFVVYLRSRMYSATTSADLGDQLEPIAASEDGDEAEREAIAAAKKVLDDGDDDHDVRLFRRGECVAVFCADGVRRGIDRAAAGDGDSIPF